QPNGGTILITFQLDGGGATPYTDTLDIDNLTLTMVPEPSSLALCALGGLGAFVVLRQRKAQSVSLNQLFVKSTTNR
ncbi:MAG TPA: PEP-CTERM sorting domain-containing protein, partial [Phycisphaerae bacterium]|nr:PEP-CTERM sorting domain-containing protein [Phycisphaerae bacterium]